MRKDLGGEGRSQGDVWGSPGGENYRQREEQMQRPWGGCDVLEGQQGGLCGQNQVREGQRSGDEVREVTGIKICRAVLAVAGVWLVL